MGVWSKTMRKLSVMVGIIGMMMTVSLTARAAGVKGAVRFKGKAPKASKIPITKDNAVCGEGQRIVDEVRVKNGLLEDVAVFVHGKIDGAPPSTNGSKAFEILQKGCRFNPFVSGIPKGSKLKIVNGDPVAHNIHAYELIGRARRDLFNFQQPHEGHTKEKKMKVRRGDIVQLQCDIHDFMRGWIIVPQNPFVTVAKDGKYDLTGIPPGEHTIKAFHPVLGVLEKKVTLKDGADETLDFEFTAKK